MQKKDKEALNKTRKIKVYYSRYFLIKITITKNSVGATTIDKKRTKTKYKTFNKI